MSDRARQANRRIFLSRVASVAGAALLGKGERGLAAPSSQNAPDKTMIDTILFNGRITTLDPAHPSATAVAINKGLFSAVGDDLECGGH